MFKDINPDMFGFAIFIIFGLFLFLLVRGFDNASNRDKALIELKAKSDSYVLLTSGKYENIYYTNSSTIKITENGSCISFIDNSTSKPVSACTQFIIKGN